MGGIDTGEGDFIHEFAFDIFFQIIHFGFGKGAGEEAVTEGVAVAGLAAAFAFGGVGGGHEEFLSI